MRLQFNPVFLAFIVWWIAVRSLTAADISRDRTICFVPLAPSVKTALIDSTSLNSLPNRQVPTKWDEAWKAYLKLWYSHHLSPSAQDIRKCFSLPSTEAVYVSKATRDRSAPRWLPWRPGTYHKVETHHFQVYSHASEPFTRLVAEDAERFYWVWTQLFFPFWEGKHDVQRALAKKVADESAPVIPVWRTGRAKMRIVIFANAAEYESTLSKDEPGIGVSTGYYSEGRQTTFLFDGADDRATRYHELTHQLFREATDSQLGSKSPGEASGFWLVEGIAGYLESLSFHRQLATVGGWDSSRLQYARYRIIVGGDHLPLAELSRDGRKDAQARSDLARYYAHAITYTHWLLDGFPLGNRKSVYAQLGDLYRIDIGLSSASIVSENASQIREFLCVTDDDIVRNADIQPPQEICLAGCEVTSIGLEKIPPSEELQWLDLSRNPAMTLADVIRLCTRPTSLKVLSLEAAGIAGEDTAQWLRQATELAELDLSRTPVDDLLAPALRQMKGLDTLWLTGTRVSDRLIETIAALPNLASVDLQETAVTASGIEKLRRAKPTLKINPLELR
jgi:hypothetical protein